jgi:hypothetical protein
MSHVAYLVERIGQFGFLEELVGCKNQARHQHPFLPGYLPGHVSQTSNADHDSKITDPVLAPMAERPDHAGL